MTLEAVAHMYERNDLTAQQVLLAIVEGLSRVKLSMKANISFVTTERVTHFGRRQRHQGRQHSQTSTKTHSSTSIQHEQCKNDEVGPSNSTQHNMYSSTQVGPSTSARNEPTTFNEYNPISVNEYNPITSRILISAQI
nr:uncharacterized protein LOC111994358 [Quercus suber]XP_023919201.1 uncharacterized protein LOC112030767 [Quercus suber]